MPAHLKQVRLPAFGELSEQPKIPTAIYEARATAAYYRAGADWLSLYADREPVTLADATLWSELRTKHPACSAGIESRRSFMRDSLGISVRPSILPLSSTPLYFPPFWFRPDHVLVRD